MKLSLPFEALFDTRAYWTGPFTLKDPELNRIFGLGSRSAAGPIVNELTAFAVAAFWDGVNQISSDVAKLPLNLRIRRQDGGSDPYEASKVYKLLKFSPNPETRSMPFRRTITAHALVYGNGYAEIVRDRIERPSALWIIHPTKITPERDENGALRYRLSDGDRLLAPRDVLHLHGLGDDGVMGFNVVSVAREALGLALASQQFASAFFGNSTMFGGVLSSDQDLDDEQAAELREKIEALHARADKAFRLLVLGAGFKFQPFGMKLNEAQMKELREQSVVEIARYLNIQPHKLKELTRSTNNNIEHQDLEYYKGCLLNWITLWEQELDAKLVSPLEQGRQFFKHNVNAFLRGAIKERYEALGIARDKGVISADEWRDLEDMNPQDGGQGKVYLVQSAQIPVDQLPSLIDAQIESMRAKAKPSEPAPDPPTNGDDRGWREALRIAEERARRAEALAAEAQQQAQEAREQLIAAQASGTATSADELTTLREAFQRQHAHAAELLALSESLRERVDLIQAAKDTTDDEARQLAVDKAAMEARLELAHEALARATQAQREAEADADEARRLEADAKQRAEAAENEARTARAAAEQAERDQAAAQVALRDAEAARDAARTAAEQSSLSEAEAQQLADEARMAAETARQQAEAADAEKVVALQRAAEAEEMAADARRQVEVASSERTAAEEARQDADAALETARSDAERMRAEAEDRVTAEAVARATAERERDEASREREAAEQARHVAEAALEAASADAERMRAEADARIREAAAVSATAERERDEAQAARDAALADVEQARTALADAERRETTLAEAQPDVAQLVSDVEVKSAALADAEARLADAVQRAEAAEQRAAETADARTEAECRAEAAERARDAARQAEIERRTRMVAAHRALMVDAMTRMVRREVQHARNRQMTPQKLRKSLETFPTLHGDVCLEALTPVVRVILANRASDESPETVTQQLVADHLAALQAQIRLALDANDDEFHAVLDRVLSRWESDRPAVVADAFLMEEIRALRAL